MHEQMLEAEADENSSLQNSSVFCEEENAFVPQQNLLSLLTIPNSQRAALKAFREQLLFQAKMTNVTG